MNRPPPGTLASSASEGHTRALEAVQALWIHAGPKIVGRLAVLEDAVAALREGRLDDQQRSASLREAHKLAGTVGSFGFTRGSELARELEAALEGSGTASTEQVSRLTAVVGMLRADMQSRMPWVEQGRTAAPEGGDERRVLLVDDDVELAARLRTEARARGLRLSVARNPERARRALARELPAAVLLDLSFDDGVDEALSLLEDLGGRTPPVPTLVLTAHETLADRVEVMRRGAHGFLPKSLPLAQVLETVSDLLRRRQAEDTTVLAVDDDHVILDLLKATLEPCGLKLVTLTDPLRFWDTLEQCAPELLILDLDMPDLSGLELCRVVRNDARLASLPVLFLTAHADPETLTRAFRAGADDYVTKPIVGPELVARITNRLERIRLHRRHAETDSLTGLANRRKGEQAATMLLRLASRLHQPLSVAVVDLDRMKQLNDRYGHAAGDEALRRVAALLQNSFRGEDVVARWGGEEFLIALYGLARRDAVERLAQVLEDLRAQDFRGVEGHAFSVTFSGGVAQYPDDGTDLSSLYRTADSALYQAKADGRDRVCPAVEAQSHAVDVVVATPDDPLADSLVQALHTRGYRVARVTNGQEAAEQLFGLVHRARLLILDADLPEAPQLAALCRNTVESDGPATKVILVAGASEDRTGRETLRPGTTTQAYEARSIAALLKRVRLTLAG